MPAKGQVIEMAGMVCGHLTVLSQCGMLNHEAAWKCRCKCGKEVVVRGKFLRDGRTISCGCSRNEHGLSYSDTYSCWKAIKSRCYRKSHRGYKDYGGRGIVACSGIRESVVGLVAVIGVRASRRFSVDRINNNGSYTCGMCDECKTQKWVLNVRWATKKTQARNTRTNRIVEIFGVSKTVSEWAEVTGLKVPTIHGRLRCGMAGESLILPVTPDKGLAKKIQIGDATRTAKEWQSDSGVLASTILKRFRKGVQGRDLLSHGIVISPAFNK